MRTIICKKCGAEIDAALGECPNCGAVYYILPEENKKLEWAMSTDTDLDETQVFGKTEASQPHGGNVHSTRDILNADNDELFNTRVWRLSEEAEADKTVPLRPVEKTGVGQTPVHRPVAPRPVRQPVQQPAQREYVKPNKNGDVRKKQLVVAAVALLAILTLVLSIMGGLFDFSGGTDENNLMPDVLGYSELSATTLLESRGLVVVPMYQQDDGPVGTVIEQSIKKDKKIKQGDSVTLVISSGKSLETTEATEYVDVPVLTGKTFEEARRALTDLDLSITRAEDAFSAEEIGVVISQSPMKGAKLQKGDLVTVTVSKGPETTEFTITVTAGKGGSISPKGAVTVEEGADQTFTFTPEEGYEVREVKVDGTGIGAATNYAFTKVTEDHTIYVVFQKKTETSPTPSPSPSTPVSSDTDIG